LPSNDDSFEGRIAVIDMKTKPVSDENLERKSKSDSEFLEQFKLDEGDYTEDQKFQLKELLMKHRKVFGEHDYDVGTYTDIKLEINTGDSDPISCKRPIPIPFAQKDKVSQVLDCTEKEGIIRKSSSPWAAPLQIVMKKHDKIRPVINYKPLNRVLKKDRYPLPRIEELLANFKGAKYFTTLDMNSGFYNVGMAED